MKRQIEVSTAVYAAIWASRQNGEETEDQILVRLLSCETPGTASPGVTNVANSGFFDMRNNVNFAPGFKISRSYKGKSYAAEAKDRHWVRLDNGMKFRSLNQLNASIVDGSAESVWNGSWTYVAENGEIRSINDLRK